MCPLNIYLPRQTIYKTTKQYSIGELGRQFLVASATSSIRHCDSVTTYEKVIKYISNKVMIFSLLVYVMVCVHDNLL